MATSRVTVDSVLEKLTIPVKYTPESLGLLPFVTKGSHVKICLIDSGVPDHEAIINIAGDVNFSDSPDSRDHIGHATLLAGLIIGDGKDFTGIAPNANLLFAKIVDDTCHSRSDALVAAILWGVIKEVDIIAIPLSTDIDSPAVHDAIKKAHKRGICVIASAGNEKKVLFPAQYPEVLAVGALDEDGKLATFSAEGEFNILGRRVVTTYLEQSFAVVSGSSVATGFAVGAAALCIEQLKNEQINPTPSTVYKFIKENAPPRTCR